MNLFKEHPHEDNSITQTLPGCNKELLEESNRIFLNESQANSKTKVYEPRPLTPDDPIYEDIMEQFASRPTKPKFWFEEFGDYWSCSCGHINKGEICTGCGLDRTLLRSLFILHRPSDAESVLSAKVSQDREAIDKEAEYSQMLAQRANAPSSTDLQHIKPIEEPVSQQPPQESIDITSDEAQLKQAPEASQSHSEPKTPPVLVETQVMTAPAAAPPAKPPVSFASRLFGKEHKKRNILIIIIAVVLLATAGCGYAYYQNVYLPQQKYDSAVSVMKEGKYEEAITLFSAMGNYKDAPALIRDCYVGIGDTHFKKKEYGDALDAYKEAQQMQDNNEIQAKIRSCYVGMGDKYLKDKKFTKALDAYKEAQDMKNDNDIRDKIQLVKYSYVKSNQKKGGDRFESYLAELMGINYPGIQEIYDRYYAWHASVIANTSEDDYSTSMTTFSRSDTIYFHAKLSGGEPDEKIKLFYVIKWPDGYKEIQDLNSDWKSGSKITARFMYPMPIFGVEGDMTFVLLDKESNEELAVCKVKIKDERTKPKKKSDDDND